MTNQEIIFSLRNVSKVFQIGKKKQLRAVNNISLDIRKGEIAGLVGESGCGKTTLGSLLVRLQEPTSGEILFHGTSIASYNRAQRMQFCKKLQMVFQDPYASLDPRMTIPSTIPERLTLHKMYTPAERKQKVRDLLEMVGLDPEFGNRFPHEFSGGQRQRIGIARALAIEPEFIVCDEPISALDVSIQAQTVNLLKSLQDKLKLTYLFITHDLNMVKYISDRVAVMYLGTMVELANSDDLYNEPLHPYTRALMAAVPVADPEIERVKGSCTLQGDVPSPVDINPGCPFYSRCPVARPECETKHPEFKEVKPEHFVACHLL